MLDLLEEHKLDLLSKKYLKAIYAKGYANIPNLSIDEVRSKFGFIGDNKDFFSINLNNKNISYKLFNSPVPTNKLIIYLHGGAYVLRNDKQNARNCLEIANRTKSDVILLHYSLTPEVKFPEPINEVSLFLQNLDKLDIKDIKSKDIYLFGESSGANLAVASILNSKVNFIKGLILINPSLDYYNDYGSKVEFSENYLLDENVRRYFATQYINTEEDRKNPLVSPVLSEDLSILPKTFIANSYHDPVRDEAFVFHAKLLGKNLDSELHTFNTIHSFLSMNIKPYSDHCFVYIESFLSN